MQTIDPYLGNYLSINNWLTYLSSNSATKDQRMSHAKGD